MIRTCGPADSQAVIDMATDDPLLTPDIIRPMLDNYSTLVWAAEGHIKGVVCYQEESQGEFNIRIYTAPPYRRTGIGEALYKTAMSQLKNIGSGRITARYRSDKGDGRAFYTDRGFTYWYALDELLYTGDIIPEPKFDIRPYEDKFFDQFIRIRSEAFYPQRRFFDFRPHKIADSDDPGSARKRALDCKNNIYLAFLGRSVVGEVEIEGNFIDVLSVSPESQGKGYGKALMQHAVNTVLNKGCRSVRTSVVMGNIAAWHLYANLGFESQQITEYACKWI